MLGAYLLGSIPFGLLASKLFHTQDPRGSGSGNIGFTNVLRVSGKKAGILTLLGDFGKGAAVALLAGSFFKQETWVLAITFAVILGHIFSVFLRFKGGKGVATALGAILGLNFPLGLTMIGIWLVTVVIFKYSSGGALVSFGVLPIIVFFTSNSSSLFIFSVVVTICIFWRHQSNIMNIWQGTESKVNNLSS
ncbi:MAG: glycerol-3-phosphate 1-O-acyltransferase PlsY [Nitrospirales bacterium]|nr:glycerol-3-phosphate 1-O-acyltransferase PlsY [Nitrospirales bacterium]